MIQRIQTLFLLLAAILSVVMFFCPMEALYSNSETLEFGLLGVSREGTLLYSTWPLMVLASLCTLLSIGAIFCYTDRILQSRLCVLNILLWIGFVVMFGVYMLINSEKFEGMESAYKLPMIFPIVNIISIFLANKNIHKDEELVRSYEHLR